MEPQQQSSSKSLKSSSSSEDHPRQIAPAHYTSSPQKHEMDEYFRHMPAIDKKQIEDYQKLLEENGFTHTKGIYHQFEAIIIQAKNQMIIYQVSFGEYKTEISAFCSNIDLSQTRSQIGSGNFGKVFKLKLSDEKKLVAKCIRKPQSLLYPSTECLKEVFMVKFASILGVGPKYHKEYCYDVLVLKSHCEFLMEHCQESKLQDDKTRNQRIQSDILYALAILHSLKAVHMDIKPDNIAYSPHFHKFVLIDFGFAEMIKESIGESTFIFPRGTFGFMSEEMQKATKLNQKGYIDLYSNDLFGLRESSKRTVLLLFIVRQDKQTNRWLQFIDYFKVSYYLHISCYTEFERLVMSNRSLPFCLRRLVRQGDLDEKTKTKYVKYLNQVCQQKYENMEYDEILDTRCADSELYVQLNKAESASLEKYEKDLKNIEVLYHQKEFKDLWWRRGWIDQIFKLLFVKKKLPIEERELKQKLVEFIYYQRPFDYTQKWLKVLEIFKEQYEVQMNTKHLLQIRYLYESAGLFNQANRISFRIWELVLNSENQLFYVLNLKYLFCQFIINQLHGFNWNPIFSNDLLAAVEKKHSPFDICLKIIDQLAKINQSKYHSKPTKQTFYHLWDLLNELQNLIKEEKAKMIIQKLKRLLLHLQYNLIDICYVATNEHQQKQEIEEKVKLDINDPIFNFKREFMAILNNREIYHLKNSMTEMTRRIQKYCKNYVPFLSRIESIWQFGQFIEAEKFKQAERVLEVGLNNMVMSNGLGFFYVMFNRHLIQSFKHSDKCFRIFTTFLLEILNFQAGNGGIKGDLKLTNQFLLKISALWDILYYLNNQDQKIRQLVQFLSMISQRLKRSSDEEENKFSSHLIDQATQVSKYIVAIANNLRNAINGDHNLRDTTAIQLLHDLSLSNPMFQCIDGCFSLFQVCSKFFSADLDRISQQYIMDIFNKKQSLELAIIYVRHEFIHLTIVQNFCKNQMYIQLMQFELQVSFQLKHSYFMKKVILQFQDRIFIFEKSLPRNSITEFCNCLLSIQLLQEVYNNSILVFILFRCLKSVRETLDISIQKRLLVLISHGLPMFTRNHPIRQIKGYVLKIQLSLNKHWANRKKLINLKREKIFLEVSLINYRKGTMKRMKEIRKDKISHELKPKREKEMLRIFEAKLKSLKIFDD